MKLCTGWVVVLALATAANAFEIASDATNITFRIRGQPILVYCHAGYPFKPYAAQLYSPTGVPILRDAPFDHKHHHGLMFALAADGVTYWEEVATSGRQVQRCLTIGTDGFTQQLDWRTPVGSSALRETRVVRLHAAPGVTLLSWHSTLATPPGKTAVILTGHHYYGLGMRFVTSMDGTGTFVNATGQLGEIVRGDERLTSAAWSALTAPAAGKVVTVALFDHPANLRHPNKLFTMSRPFAYLSATLNLWQEPFTLKAEQVLALCYGVAAWDGRANAAQIEQTYRHWLTLTSSASDLTP